MFTPCALLAYRQGAHSDVNTSSFINHYAVLPDNDRMFVAAEGSKAPFNTEVWAPFGKAHVLLK
jgi:hypothetical protein